VATAFAGSPTSGRADEALAGVTQRAEITLNLRLLAKEIRNL
jgi:hypothetical protein